MHKTKILTALLIAGGLTLQPLPLWAQPAANLPETERYTRKHISFYLEEPTYPLNQVLIDKFRNQMPRFDYHLISTQMGANLPEFLAHVQRHQREKAGELAASDRKTFGSPEQGQLKVGEKVVTWSETQDIAKAAFVFGSHWHFSPVYLTGPRLISVEENEKGEFKHPELPADAYTQIRVVKKKKYNKKLKKDEEVDVRELLYWQVGAGTDLALKMGIFELAKEPAQLYFNWNDSWYIGNQYVVTNQDMAAAKKLAPKPQEFDPEKAKDQAYLLKIRRFQAMLTVEPSERYMDQAVNQLTWESGWFSSLSTQLKQKEAFILKSEVTEVYSAQDRARASFGEKESARFLGVKTRDWLEQVEWTEQDGVMSKKNLGFIRIRGFYQDDMLVQPVFVPRNLELGDSLQETPSARNGHLGVLGGYYSFPGNLSGPSLSFDVSWATETLSPDSFRQRIQEKIAQNPSRSELELALEESSSWEWNYLLGATLPVDLAKFGQTRKFFLDLHLGLNWRRYERQWVYNLGLAPMLIISNGSKASKASTAPDTTTTDSAENKEERETLPEAFGVKFLAGVGYAFNPNFSLELQGSLMLAAPYGLGGEAQFQLFF